MIHLDHIKSSNYKKVCYLIMIHLSFIVIAIILLFLSRIPEKPDEYPDFPQKSLMLDKSFQSHNKS